jgi:hypothetical protein
MRAWLLNSQKNANIMEPPNFSHKKCSVAQLVVRKFDSRLGTPERFSPLHEHKCNEEMERGLGDWRWMNLLYHCMNVIRNACVEKDKINKEWQLGWSRKWIF